MTARNQSILHPPKTGEDKLVGAFLLLSLAGHGVFFVFDRFDFFKTPAPLVNEWSIDTELITDVNMTAPDKTALPDAKIAEKAEVPSNMLPQMTKKFAVEETPKDEEGIAEPLPKPEPKKEEGKANDTKEESLSQTKPDEQETKVAMKDALKRLALEKLRKEQKEKSKEVKAQEADPLARIADQLKSSDKLNRGVAGGMNGSADRKYGAQLVAIMKRVYALPKTYKITDPNVVAVLAIVLNERGELVSVDVYQSSNDAALDEYAMAAARAGAPYPPPPEGQVGRQIIVNFTP